MADSDIGTEGHYDTMTTQDEQLRERHQLPEALDKLRDAVSEAGPNEDEHERVLQTVVEEYPTFGVLLLRLLALRAQDDVGEVTPDSPVGQLVVKLVNQQTGDVVSHLQDEGANVLLESLVGLGVASRLAGLTKWHAPETVDEDDPTA